MENRKNRKVEKVIVSVLDNRSGVYSPPVFAESVDSSKRDFAMLFLDAKSVYALCPSDFTLCLVGYYGCLTVWPVDGDKPLVVCDGVDAAAAAKAMIARSADVK